MGFETSRGSHLFLQKEIGGIGAVELAPPLLVLFLKVRIFAFVFALCSCEFQIPDTQLVGFLGGVTAMMLDVKSNKRVVVVGVL